MRVVVLHTRCFCTLVSLWNFFCYPYIYITYSCTRRQTQSYTTTLITCAHARMAKFAKAFCRARITVNTSPPSTPLWHAICVSREPLIFHMRICKLIGLGICYYPWDIECILYIIIRNSWWYTLQNEIYCIQVYKKSRCDVCFFDDDGRKGCNFIRCSLVSSYKLYMDYTSI